MPRLPCCPAIYRGIFIRSSRRYADFAAQYGPGYAGYTFPQFEAFTVTERFPSTGSLSAYALGDELLRATFTEDGREGEGMFAASVVDLAVFPSRPARR